MAKLPDDISFWDVVEAVEGSSYNFQCHEIRQREIILDQSDLPESYEKCPCLIKTVMTEAEELMRDSLRKKNISWLQKEVSKKMSKELSDKKTEWFEK